MGSSESQHVNKLELLNASFLWKTKNFSKVPDGEWFNSPTFTISALSYHLELHKDDDIQIRLKGDQTFSEALKFRCKVSVLDLLGHEHHTKVKEITVKKGINEEAILVVFKKKNSVLPNDTLTISFKMTALNDDEPTGKDSAAFLETLSSDLGKSFEDSINTDSILNTKSKQFLVHRAVLSARSKVFEAMFHHDTSESCSGEVNIKDVDEHVMEEALYYIYTGKVSRLTADTARALYVVADKYALVELKKECMKSIISSLTINNICEAALLADNFYVAPLKHAIVTLVQENRDKVLKSEHWGIFSIEKPHIANSILSETLLASKV